MLRILLISFGLASTLALPALADDMDICRDKDKQAEPAARLDACEKVIAAGQVSGKDLAIALGTRGNALINNRDYDKAIVALNAAHDADPDNVGILNLRGISYERKGQDDLALADYDLALQKRPTFGVPYNNRGTIQVHRKALQSALDDFNLSIKYAPKFLLGYTNRARLRTVSKDFDGALADYAEAAAQRFPWD